MDLLLVALGLIVLFVGGEATLRGAIGLAQALCVTPAVIGLTVVGFGTSAPELVVTVKAALAGTPDLAIGNVVGSNIANILLILGVGGLIYPLACEPRAVKRDGLMMLFAIGLLCVLGTMGVIVRWHGIVMLILLATFIIGSYMHDRRLNRLMESERLDQEDVEAVPHNMVLIIVFIIIGLAGLVGGAHMLVIGATGIAREMGIPESVIGLTLVAVGTSLPELAATIIAAWRKHTELAIANAMGSCVFNVLCILGITALIKPIPIAPDIQSVDLWVMLATTVLFLPLLWWTRKINRLEGAALLGLYLVYIGSMGPRIPAMS